MEKIKSLFINRIEAYKKILNDEQIMLSIYQAGEMLRSALFSGAIVLICGNGGSAAAAQHMAGEIVGRFQIEREGLSALALTADTSILTAVGNDYGYDEIFARYVTAFKDSAKMLFLLSTSGNSQNLIKAAVRAKDCGINTVCLLGKDGGPLKELCGLNIIVPSWSTPEIQEVHLMIIHFLCQMIDSQCL